MTCCPKWRRPSNTVRRRSARVHSERLPDMLGRVRGLARHGRSPQRGLPINNKMRALSAARNLRMRAEIRNGETATQTRRSPDNSAPRRPPPGSSRLQANKHPAGASSPEARCFGRGSSEKRTANRRSYLAASRFTCVPEVFAVAANFRTARQAASAVQAAPRPSSKRRTLRISGSIFSLRKLGACSGHCTVQRMPLTRLVS